MFLTNKKTKENIFYKTKTRKQLTVDYLILKKSLHYVTGVLFLYLYS